MTVLAGKDIAKGEHLSIMYTHSLWGTWSRRDHLNNVKNFWCTCPRCEDPTEMGEYRSTMLLFHRHNPLFVGTNFSSIKKNGKLLLCKNPLDQGAPWVSKDGTEEWLAVDVQDDMTKIGAELAILQISKYISISTEKFSLMPQLSEGTVEDYEEFLAKYESQLHPNHYHMLTAKHCLMQMMGRVEGCLIQDMSKEQV